MSTVPADIAGVGSTLQKLRVSPGFDPLKAAVGPEEYFVLSRIDGNQTIREILLTIGLPVERTTAIVIRLRSIGALLLPGEAAPPPAVVAAKPRAATVQGVSAAKRPPTPTAPAPTVGPRPSSPAVRSDQSTSLRDGELSHELQLSHPTQAEQAALAEENDLTDIERQPQ